MRFSRIALSSSCLLLTLALLAGAQDGKQSSDAAKQAYAFAKTFQDKKLYDDAIRQWQKFLKDHGKDPLAADAFSNLGVSQLLGKHYRDAAVTLRALLDKHPKYEGADAATFNLGLALFNIGLESKKPDDFKAAADAFGQLPVKYTKSKYAPQALYYQGECHFNAGNAQQALAFYRKAISAYPEATILPDVYYALGTAQQDALKQYKDAADTYADFLKKYPRDTYADEIRLRRGDCLVELKDYAEAERVLAEAAGNPNFEFADYALLQQARAVSEQKNFAKAAELYASLTKKFPASKRQEAALVGAGKNYHLAGKHNEAQQALRAVADKNGKHSAEGAYWLAQSLIKTGKPTEASTVAERALAAFPKDEFAPHLELVRIDAIDAQPDKKKQAAQLYADFAKKHAGQPLAARAQYLAALTALQAGDSSGAAKLAEDFLADAKQGKSPLVPEVQFIAGESALLKSPADYVRAETHFRNLVENNADHERAPQARLRIAHCLHLGKKYDASISYLQQSLGALKDPELTAEAQLLMARNYLAGNQLDQAVNACKKAQEARSDWERGDEVLFELATAYRGQKKLNDAAAQLKKLVDSHPKSALRAHALYELGDLAYQQKKYDEAVAPLEKLAQDFPKEPLAANGLNLLGRAYLAKKEYKEAAAAVSKALALAPDSDAGKTSRYLRGLASQQLGQFDAAAQDLQAFIDSKPANPDDALDARFALAKCQAGLKKFPEAVQSLQTILKEKSDYAQADKVLYDLGFALAGGNDEAPTTKESAEAFRRLADTLPKSPYAGESLLRLGLFEEKNKQLAEAAKDYQAGIALAGKPELHERLQHQLGLVRYKEKKYDEAAAAFQAQLKDHANGPFAEKGTFWAAESFYEAKRPREAVARYEQLIKQNAKENAELVLYHAARCHADLLDWPQTQKRCAELIAQYPKFKLIDDARYRLGQALVEQRKFDDARKEFARVATDGNNTEEAAKCEFQLGALAMNDKDYKQAITHFVKLSVRPYPEWQAKAHFYAGTCFQHLKDHPRALEEFETLVKKYPSSPEAEKARKTIVELKK